MIPSKQTTTLLGVAASFGLSLLGVAKHENKELPINSAGREMTISFYHFTKTSDVIILPLNKNVGKTLSDDYAAGVSLASTTGISIINGVIELDAKANYVLKDSTPQSETNKSINTNGKHTFLLSNGKGRYAIGYSPFMNIMELNYALNSYFKTAKQGYVDAVILANGNQCAFYKSNKGYHPFYLKELKSPTKVLAVKRVKR